MIGIYDGNIRIKDFRTNKIMIRRGMYDAFDKSKDIILTLPNINTIPYWHVIDKNIIDVENLNLEFIFNFNDIYHNETLYLYSDFFKELKNTLSNNKNYKFNIGKFNGKTQSIEEITTSMYHLSCDSIDDVDLVYSPLKTFNKNIYLNIVPEKIEYSWK